MSKKVYAAAIAVALMLTGVAYAADGTGNSTNRPEEGVVGHPGTTGAIYYGDRDETLGGRPEEGIAGHPGTGN